MFSLLILESQTMWSSKRGGTHSRGGGEVGEDIGDFIQYWQTMENHCSYFKSHQVGWFVHTYDDSFEDGFGMLKDDGNPKMSFFPPKC